MQETLRKIEKAKEGSLEGVLDIFVNQLKSAQQTVNTGLSEVRAAKDKSKGLQAGYQMPPGETDAKDLINTYISRYRPQPKFNGLSSFTTMQTALNSLAGHYTTYSNRPLPEQLHDRLVKELSKAEKAVARGN